MKIYRVFALFLFISTSAFAAESAYIDDHAKFLSEEDRHTYTAIAEELKSKTGFSLYLHTSNSEDEYPEATAKLICDSLDGNLRALIYIDLNGAHRAVAKSASAEDLLSKPLVERLAQKSLLPQFRKDAHAKGILLFEAELAKSVARSKDVRLNVRMPKADDNEMPTTAWVLIAIVFGSLIAAFVYFSKQNSKAKRRQKIRDFGGFPHQKFDSGFGN
ncbi:MAG: TPM domain-containing protein [Fibrobacteraceae bacterium]|nr:TPM domain-containing protein [Fibrobacteraceae bacterium]